MVFQAPLRDMVTESDRLVSPPWKDFFTLLKKILDPLGVEKSFTLVNNQALAAEITGLAFDSSNTKQAIIEYFVQRVTTGGGAVELHETGLLYAVWQQTTEAWSISNGVGYPEDAGIVFSIATSGTVGNVKYTTTNETGTASVSKLSYRVRSMVG